MKKVLGFALLTSLVLFGCSQAEEASSEAAEDAAPAADVGVDEVAAVRALAESWDGIANVEDIDGMMGMFTADAIRLGAGQPAMIGAAACRAGFEAGWAAGDSEGYNPIDDLAVAGNWAWVRGTFTDKTTSDSDETTEARGKWVSIVRKTDDGWKYAIDVWNNDAPSTSAAADFDRGELPGEFMPSSPDEEAALAAASGWDAANNAEDADALVALYAEDGIRMPADAPTVQGTEALRQHFEDSWATQKPDGSGPTLGLEVEGDWAFLWGTWADRPTDKTTGEVSEDGGKWLNIMQRTPAGWKIHTEIWNRDS